MLKVLSILFVAMIVLSGCGEIAGNKLPAEAEAAFKEYIADQWWNASGYSYRITSVQKASYIPTRYQRNDVNELYCLTIDPPSHYTRDSLQRNFIVFRVGMRWETKTYFLSTALMDKADFDTYGCKNWKSEGDHRDN